MLLLIINEEYLFVDNSQIILNKYLLSCIIIYLFIYLLFIYLSILCTYFLIYLFVCLYLFFCWTISYSFVLLVALRRAVVLRFMLISLSKTIAQAAAWKDLAKFIFIFWFAEKANIASLRNSK